MLYIYIYTCISCCSIQFILSLSVAVAAVISRFRYIPGTVFAMRITVLYCTMPCAALCAAQLHFPSLYLSCFSVFCLTSLFLWVLCFSPSLYISCCSFYSTLFDAVLYLLSHWMRYAALYSCVLPCWVLCCAVLSIAELCCVFCYALPHCVSLCSSVLRYAWLRFAVLRCASLRFAAYALSTACLLHYACLLLICYTQCLQESSGLFSFAFFVFLFYLGLLNLHGAEGYANTAHEHAER